MNRNYAVISIVIIIVLCFGGLFFFWGDRGERSSGSPGGKYDTAKGSGRSPELLPVRETAVSDSVAKPESRGNAEAPVIEYSAEKTGDPAPQAEIRYSIEGRVADSSTKAPVHNAVVQMASITCLTDELGIFKFNFDAKINSFQVMRIEKKRSYKSVFQEIRLQKGVPEQDLGVFYLAGDGFTGTVEGSVYDINGLLLDNADIALFESNTAQINASGFDYIDLNKFKTRSEMGQYSFIGLPAGRYRIRAGSKTLKTTETASFTLAEGEKKILDIRLTTEKIRYAGRVTDQETNPVENAILFLHNTPDADDDICSLGTNTFKLVHTGANGKFEVFLNMEADRAMVYKETFTLALAGITAGDGNNIVLVKGKVIIKGYVLQKDTEKPVQGVRVWLETDNESNVWKNLQNFVNEGIFAVTGTPGDVYDGDRKINLYSLINNLVGTDQNGYFEFPAVPAGFGKMRCGVGNGLKVIYRTEFFTDDGADEKNIICRIPSFAENVEFAVIDAETGESTGPNTYIKANKTDAQTAAEYFYWFMKNSITPGSYAIEVTAEGYETLKTQLDVTLETSGRKITYKLQKDKNHTEILISGKVYENNLIARSYNFVINPQPDERIGMGWGGYEKNILTDGDGNYQFVLDSSMFEELRNESRKSGQVKLTLHCYSNTAETAVEILLNEQDFYNAKNEKVADIYLTAK